MRPIRSSAFLLLWSVVLLALTAGSHSSPVVKRGDDHADLEVKGPPGIDVYVDNVWLGNTNAGKVKAHIKPGTRELSWRYPDGETEIHTTRFLKGKDVDIRVDPRP